MRLKLVIPVVTISVYTTQCRTIMIILLRDLLAECRCHCVHLRNRRRLSPIIILTCNFHSLRHIDNNSVLISQRGNLQKRVFINTLTIILYLTTVNLFFKV